MNVHANGIKNRCIKLEKPYWPIKCIRLIRRLKIKYKYYGISYLDPYCEPCQDLVYGSNSSMIDGSFSISIVDFAQEQVIAEHKNTLMINMTKNRIPNVMQSGHTQC